MSYLFDPDKNFFDLSGRVLAFGKVYFCTPDGTANINTLKTIYTTDAKNVTASNPQTLTATGRFAQEVHGTGLYDIVIKTSALATVRTLYSVPASYASDALSVTFTPSSGAAETDLQTFLRAIYQRTAAEIAASVTPTNYYYPYGDIRRYGGVADGATPNQTALATALLAVGADGTVYIPQAASAYHFTATVQISQQRQRIVGEGIGATTLTFTPTAADTLFEIGDGSTQTFQCEIAEMTIKSADTTYAKVAIDIRDTSMCKISRVSIFGTTAVDGTLTWTGSTSTGIRCRGREMASFEEVYIAADRPIWISQNPNRAAASNIDIDHFNFIRCYFIAASNPVVTIDTGVNLTNVNFLEQAWVKGTNGLYWVDTTTTITGANLTLKDVRWEQGTDSTGYGVRIEHAQNVYGVKLDNFYTGVGTRGFKFRKIIGLTLDDTKYAGTGVALDVDNTVQQMQFRNAYWETTSTATVTGQKLLWGLAKPLSGSPLPGNALYAVDTTDGDILFERALKGDSQSVANNGVVALGTAAFIGTVYVHASGGEIGVYECKGGFNTTREVRDADGVFTTSAGSASSINIYWSGANSRYELENKRGSTLTINILRLGVTI